MTTITVVDQRFGPLLRQFREKRGLSLRRFARLAHYSHTHLWDFEVGRKRPSLAIAQRLDAALDAEGQLLALVSEQTLPMQDSHLRPTDSSQRRKRHRPLQRCSTWSKLFGQSWKALPVALPGPATTSRSTRRPPRSRTGCIAPSCAAIRQCCGSADGGISRDPVATARFRRFGPKRSGKGASRTRYASRSTGGRARPTSQDAFASLPIAWT